MTERRPANRRPGSAPVFWISIALFCLLLGLVTHRLAGESGSAEGTAAEPSRKVIVRRVVTTIVPARQAATGEASPPAASSSPPVESVPASAPVEPAPVTTSAS